MGWQQLKEILENNREETAEEKAREITECPNCGFNELKENKNKDLCCPICGWTGGRYK